MINYPDPTNYINILTQMLTKNVDYVEVQLPFSNPVADGQLIHNAHNLALKWDFNLFQELQKISKLKQELNSKTKLVLMSYITPIFYFGINKVLKAVQEAGFEGVIVPDMPLGSKEQKEFSQQAKSLGISWIPLISPLTNKSRLEKIKQNLTPSQLIYATARKGKTGSKTDFENQETKNYLHFLKQNLTDFQILIGFGVRSKEHLDLLNKQGFLVVVASEMIKRIEEQNSDTNQIKTAVKQFLSEFGY
jgi:tryptophan synthase alpha chain